MKKSKIKIVHIGLLLLLILIVLSITGCEGMGGFFRGSTEAMPTYDFRKGAEGVAMQFLEGVPPNMIFVGTDFSTGIRMKNMGAYDITDKAELKITVPEDAFSFEEKNTKEFVMRGKSLYIKEGEEDVIMFPMRALCYKGYGGTKETTIIKNFTTNIKATACYYYETTASADICIDTRKHLREAHERPVCNMQAIGLSGGQGGPVGVISISPTIIPRSETEATLQLGISIKKLQGSGVQIYHPAAGCEDPKEQNKVEIDVEIGGRKLWCEPYQVQLKETEAIGTRCTTQIDPALGAYTTPISVNMKYYVKQSMLRGLTVQPPPGGINCEALKAGRAVS